VWLEQAVAAQATPQPLMLRMHLQGCCRLRTAEITAGRVPPYCGESSRHHSIQSADIAQAASAQPQSEQWHFLLVPYVYVPFFISGSANYEGSEDFRNNFCRDLCADGITGGPQNPVIPGNIDSSRDFDFTPTQIRTG
jgi:hypothetical protein